MRLIERPNTALSNALSRLVLFTTRRYLLTCLLILALLCACWSGFFFEERDNSSIADEFLPLNSQTRSDRQSIEDVFPHHRHFVVLLSTSDQSSCFEIQRLSSAVLIQQLITSFIDHDLGLSFSNISVLSSVSFSSIWDSLDDFEEDPDPVSTAKDFLPSLHLLLRPPTSSAHTLRMEFHLNSTHPQVSSFEHSLFSHISSSTLVSDSLRVSGLTIGISSPSVFISQKVSESYLRPDYHLIGYVFLAIYIAFFMGRSKDVSLRFRFVPTISCLLSITASSTAALGLAHYLSFTTTSLLGFSPLLVLAMGSDDSFTFSSALARSSPFASPCSRLSAAMFTSAGSIVLSTFTTVFAFLFAFILSPLPGIKAFCFVTGSALLINFILQVTIFPLSCYADLMFMLKYTSKPSESGKKKRGMGIGRIIEIFTEKLITLPFVVVVVFLLFLVGAGVGYFKYSQISTFLDQRIFVSEDRHLSSFMKFEQDYFENDLFNGMLVFSGDDLGTTDTFYSIHQILLELDSSITLDNSSSINLVYSFLNFLRKDEFKTYLDSHGFPKPEYFNTLFTDFLATDGAHFAVDVLLSDSSLVGLRLGVLLTGAQDTEEKGQQLNDLRDKFSSKLEETGLEGVLYSEKFQLFEQYKTLKFHIFINIAAAMVSRFRVVYLCPWFC
ncbi:hypothetical protein GEMRC1_006975 [Eukaryota sp. GEM-RC1]